MSGIDFVDGQASGFSESPFPSQGMQNGGPVDGPCGEYDRSADINITGPMAPRNDSTLRSPVDNV